MSRAVSALLVWTLVAGGRRELGAQETVFYRVQEQRECGRLGVAFLPGETLVIADLLPGSAADRAGLEPGDTLARIDGAEADPVRLSALARRLEPGDTVRFRIRRDGRERDLAVVAARALCTRVIALADRPEELRHAARDIELLPGAVLRLDSVRMDLEALLRQERIALEELRRRLVAGEMEASLIPGFGIGQRAVAGAEFGELNPGLAQYFQGAKEGLLVLQVAPETPGALAGLHPGDVLVRVGGRPVRTVGELRLAIARAGRGPVPLTVVRQGRLRELRLPLER